MNFQMFKLVLEKAEEPEIKLLTSVESSTKQESSRETSTLFSMANPFTVWITKNWKILQEMAIPDHLTCLLRNLCAGQEVTVRTGMDNIMVPNWERVCQGFILSPFSFNLNTEYIMRHVGLDEVQAGIKIAGRNISNLR